MTQPLWSGPVRENSAAQPSTNAQSPKLTLPLLRVLGQAAGNYIVAEGPDGVYVIDQHAAHERIMYEKLRRRKPPRHPGARDAGPYSLKSRRRRTRC